MKCSEMRLLRKPQWKGRSGTVPADGLKRKVRCALCSLTPPLPLLWQAGAQHCVETRVAINICLYPPGIILPSLPVRDTFYSSLPPSQEGRELGEVQGVDRR